MLQLEIHRIFYLNKNIIIQIDFVQLSHGVKASIREQLKAIDADSNITITTLTPLKYWLYAIIYVTDRKGKNFNILSTPNFNFLTLV